MNIDNQDELLDKVVGGLLHEEFPSSYAIIVPPLFGEELLGKALVYRLRTSQRCFVAHIAIDSISRPIEYIQELQRQWGIGEAPKRGASPTVTLMQLVNAIPEGVPALQVITRFEKFLDVLDASMLGAMRRLESERRLRSAVFSPFTYVDVKQRWVEQGKKLVSSNYGDAHCFCGVQPHDFKSALRMCSEMGIPEHVAKFVIEQTGAYPEVCVELIGHWKRVYSGSLFKNDVKQVLVQQAKERLRRFLLLLDMPDRSSFRDAAASVHYNSHREEALSLLRTHPWASVLLNGDEIRAQALGPLAASMSTVSHLAAFETARALYFRGSYRAALDVIKNFADTTASRMLLLHAGAMSLLIDPDDGRPGLDTDWRQVRSLLSDAMALLSESSSGISRVSIGQIEECQKRLLRISAPIADAASGSTRRIVDALSDKSPRSAFWIVMLEKMRANSLVGNSSATLAALALPEQVYRLWAYWHLELDYDVQPQDEAAWERVRELWPSVEVVPVPGRKFPSFEVFAWFSFVVSQRLGIGETAAIESTPEALKRSLSLLQIRRDQAHSLARCSDRDRRELFSLVERWMAALLAPCYAHDDQWSMFEFEELVRPLPLLARDGELDWG